MEKRTLLFVILSVGILIGYPAFLNKMGLTPPPPGTEQAAQKQMEGEVPAPAAPQGPGPETAVQPPAAMSATPPAPSVPAATQPMDVEPLEVKDVVVNTDLYRATFSTRGGAVTGWVLKQHLNDDKTGPVNLFSAPEKDATYPLAVTVDGIPRFEAGIWSVDREQVSVSGADTATVRFSRTDPSSGARVVKTLTFHGDSYRVEVEVDARNIPGAYTVSLGSNFGIREWGIQRIGFVGAASLVDDEVSRDDPGDLEDEPLVRKGNIRWTVSEDKYFIAALIPETAPERVIARSPGEDHVVGELGFARGEAARMTLYAGPKNYDELKSFKVNLQENIDFGWFMFGSWGFVRLLAEPMFVMLKWIDGMVGNWGVAIILLTLLIKTVFIPLTHKSYKSMRAMAAIQPQVKAIQNKYKDNKEKLGRETMALYKEHNVNPLGGCLPIFIQIPFFIAFFNILYTAIELRHTPFAGWIVDLSAKDPYYILPIIMGVSMFLQQKIQPTSMDPKQARIMLFLPVIFTFFFMQFPAGLVLYWLFNNLFTISQQVITMRYLEVKPVPKGKAEDTAQEAKSGKSDAGAGGKKAGKGAGKSAGKSGGKKKK